MSDADVIVIGGGIAGVSAAARIAADARVILLERESHPGAHSTGRSAAMYIAGYGNAAIRALTANARAHFDAPNPEFWRTPLLSARGEILVARADQLDLLAKPPAGCVAITARQACALAPILDPAIVAGALHDADAADIDVDALLQGYLRLLRRHCGRVEINAEVQGLTHGPGGWTVQTPTSMYRAPILVNAAGAWADKVAQAAGAAPLGLQPFRRSAAILPAPGGHDLANWPLFGGIAEDWYARPMGGKLMVSPADEDPVPPQDAFADDMVLAEGLARFEAMTTYSVTRVERNWAGLRSFLPDRTPAVGFDAVVPGFFWLAGQGGYGIQTAPAMATLAADLVAGRRPGLAPDVLAALSPARSMSPVAG